MKKQEFLKAVGTTPTNTADAKQLADKKGISFKRRNAHLKAWFGNGNGNLLPSMHNLKG